MAKKLTTRGIHAPLLFSLLLLFGTCSLANEPEADSDSDTTASEDSGDGDTADDEAGVAPAAVEGAQGDNPDLNPDAIPELDMDNPDTNDQAADDSAMPDTATDESRHCLALSDEERGFGKIGSRDVRSWLGSAPMIYAGNTDLLALGRSEDGRRWLRQKLVPSWNGSRRGLAGAALPAGRTYTLTQSVFLEEGFDWGGDNEGGKLGFGFGGGESTSGGTISKDGFTARFMWRGHNNGTAHLAVYSYAADRTQNLPYGDDYPLEGYDLPIGEWIKLTMEVTTNSSTGAADGRVRAWVDRTLYLDRGGIQWQAAGDSPAIDRLIYSTFHGGDNRSWSPEGDSFARFSDVCWREGSHG